VDVAHDENPALAVGQLLAVDPMDDLGALAHDRDAASDFVGVHFRA
jgi:hypothetical protein